MGWQLLVAENWQAAVDEGREPSVTAADGRAALEVVLAVYQSAREGRSVTLASAGAPGRAGAGPR